MQMRVDTADFIKSHKISALAPSCGKSDRTLARWMKFVDEHGFASLRTAKQPERPDRLTNEQKDKIKVAIASAPELFGYNVWADSPYRITKPNTKLASLCSFGN